MFVFGFMLFGLGALAGVFGGIWILIRAFQTSATWGLCSLFVPFAVLVFTFKYWAKAGAPFLMQIAGIVAFGAGGALLFSDLSAVAAASAQANLPI